MVIDMQTDTTIMAWGSDGKRQRTRTAKHAKNTAGTNSVRQEELSSITGDVGEGADVEGKLIQNARELLEAWRKLNGTWTPSDGDTESLGVGKETT